MIDPQGYLGKGEDRGRIMLTRQRTIRPNGQMDELLDRLSVDSGRPRPEVLAEAIGLYFALLSRVRAGDEVILRRSDGRETELHFASDTRGPSPTNQSPGDSRSDIHEPTQPPEHPDAGNHAELTEPDVNERVLGVLERLEALMDARSVSVPQQSGASRIPKTRLHSEEEAK